MTFFRQTKFWKNYLQYEPISNTSSMRGFVDAVLFWKLLSCFPRNQILEIGCYQGLTTGLFFDVCPATMVTSIDIKDRLDLFRIHYKNCMVQHKFILSASQSVHLDCNFDMIFIDGDHNYPPCWQDIQLALKHIDSAGIIAIDDYRMPGVAKAVDDLYNLKNDWVPFLQGIQTQFWHHRSQNKDEFLDKLLIDPITNFMLLKNINDSLGNVILDANCVRMLTDHYQIFDQALTMYDI